MKSAVLKMGKRRSRSLSLFQPNHNSTTNKLEGVIESEENAEEMMIPDSVDDEDLNYETDDEETFPNGQPPTSSNSSKGLLLNQLEFVKAIKLQTDDKNSEHFKKTLDQIKGNQIEGFSEENFIAKFLDIQKKMGRFRTLYSMIHDMEIYLTKVIKKFRHPDKPRAPNQPAILFIKEMEQNGKHCPADQNYFKWAHQSYSQLSERHKSSYRERYEQLKLNYYRKLKEFYEMYPEERPAKKSSIVEKQITPFNLYFDHLRQDVVNVKRANALELWKNLSVQEKVPYIKKAYQFQSENLNNDKKVMITNKEKELLDELNGKPEKPPATAYQLFIQQNVNDPNIKYKTIGTAEKLKLKGRVNEMWEEYERRVLKYIKKLPNEAKRKEQEELLENLAKYKGQKSGSKRSGSEPPADKRVTEDVIPKKRSKNVDQEDDTNVNVATNDKTKKSKLKEKRRKNEISTVPSIKTESPKKAVYEPAPVEVKKEKKGAKKPKMEKNAFTETKPPKSAFRYFLSINSFSSPSKGKKRYRKLSSSEKRTIKKAYKEVCERYIQRLREYLKSLEKHEMEAFVKELERKKEEESDVESYSEDESDADSNATSDS